MSQRRPFDSSMSGGQQSSGGNGGGGASHVQTHEMVESQNDQMVTQMADKVRQLKSISIDIGDEMRKQNSYLGGMGEEFDSAGGLLGGSMKRLKGLANAGHNRWMCYIILFIVGVFFICYAVIKWRS
ncbi:BET1 homolog [Halichondria panicea]|uniref:BET1 homolog n=1 Tax=Halichondria panicea TaxID=6063 RepID=UPI00312B7391